MQEFKAPGSGTNIRLELVQTGRKKISTPSVCGGGGCGATLVGNSLALNFCQVLPTAPRALVRRTVFKAIAHWLPDAVRTNIGFTEGPNIPYMLIYVALSAYMLLCYAVICYCMV